MLGARGHQCSIMRQGDMSRAESPLHTAPYLMALGPNTLTE
jgi:hypothetical protein